SSTVVQVLLLESVLTSGLCPATHLLLGDLLELAGHGLLQQVGIHAGGVLFAPAAGGVHPHGEVAGARSQLLFTGRTLELSDHAGGTDGGLLDAGLHGGGGFCCCCCGG
ncbi:MAG: hypothetical protein ACK56I_26090, partial [bacterium]